MTGPYVIKEFNKVIKLTEMKILQGSHLPMTIMEIQLDNEIAPIYKNIYLCLALNKLLSVIAAIQQVAPQVERCLLLDPLIFRMQNLHDKQNQSSILLT